MAEMSIVTVLFGGTEILESTIPTWRSAMTDEIEFVFVDHSREPVGQRLGLQEWGTYHWDPDNPGFAAGVNRACTLASTDRYLLLNPDVYLDEKSLRTILHHQSGDGLSAIGLRTGSLVTVGIEYTWWGFCRDRQNAASVLVGPSGGGALVEKRVFDRVGGFPEHLFAWGEDAEWALLATLAGVGCDVVPVVLDHVGGHSVASLEGQRLKARLLVRNRIATYRRLFSRSLQAALLVPFGLAIIVNLLRKILRRTGRAYLEGIVNGIRDELPPAANRRIGLLEWATISTGSFRRVRGVEIGRLPLSFGHGGRKQSQEASRWVSE